MQTAAERDEPDHRATVLLVAGFGDNASMFDGLLDTPFASAFRLLPINLPGFGAPRREGATTLDALAGYLADVAVETGAGIVVAHSVASIIASLAAQRAGSPITAILSLEGNITADDAYFSGTAADYDTPTEFRAAFLGRLEDMAVDAPVFARYRRIVAEADPQALWELGVDARRFSSEHVAGDVLMRAASTTYLYNPENCPKSTLDWLEVNPMERFVLEGASHWPSVDQPEALAARLLGICERHG